MLQPLLMHVLFLLTQWARGGVNISYAKEKDPAAAQIKDFGQEKGYLVLYRNGVSRNCRSCI